jgi:hypothetical protein
MNNFCDFVSLNDGDFYCTKCGRIVYSYDQDFPLLPCPKQNQQDPNCCSDEEISNRYNVCTNCDKFKENVCLECGCFISRAAHFTNKLYWKNNSCPLNKWEKIN